MSKFFAAKPNRIALILSNFYPNFEDGIKGLQLHQAKQRLIIKNDPLSRLHVLIQDEKNLGKTVRLEKADIAIANQDRQALYHLLATVIEQFNS